MPIHIVSDLHGASDALRKAVPEGSTLVLLGDLINFLDYTSMTGILTEVFAVDTVAEVVRLRTQGRAVEAREVMNRRSEGREEEIRRAVTKRMTAQYEEVFSALVDPTYLILGNVDSPETAHEFAQRLPAVTEADGRVWVLDGERFGFVGGALPSPLHVAGEVTHEQMRAKLDGLGEVDVLCSHIPPAVPELCYDTLAGKLERGSEDLLGYIVDVQPRRAYFGHVHQPLTSMLHVGRTLCVNTGYFRATTRSWPHQGAPIT